MRWPRPRRPSPRARPRREGALGDRAEIASNAKVQLALRGHRGPARGGPRLAQVTPEMTISSVVDRWPDTARIFARYGLSCASCAISKSETILAGATGHGGGRVNMDELMRDLNTLADTGMQALPVAGVVLVTTPQALATLIVGKAVKLVKQLGGDIIGVVENMSYVEMPDGSRNEVFGPSQGLKLVIASNAPLMGKLPIDPEIARLVDAGLIESYDSPEFEELIANFL